mmetsp:Transcript_4953/g.7509  ORF Transcript_4953/g.7509 Transcript_4953/m.7509 type:complete len:274 (+) Transcript_4953:1-822(+)
MNLLPVPMALDYDAANNLPQEGEPADESSIIYHNDGAMPVIPSAWSIARVQRDAAKRGIKSTDTEVLCNKLEILKFLNQHNTRPYMGINVEGYHTETYYRNRNGKRERHTRRVTDFAYTIDMTHFIYPYGKIHSNTESSVEEMIEEFLKDDNKLRSLQVKKRVYWNEAGLISLVRMYIRRMGWNRGLTVRPEYSNKSIRVCTDSKLAATWDSRGGRALCILTVIPAIAIAIHGSGHRERGMRSTFVVQYSPLQIFESIRPQIYVPMMRGCTVM